MNAKFNGKIWVVDVTAKQFWNMLVKFFNRNPNPTCDELYEALVPVGISNTAAKGSFRPNGIYKFWFTSSDGKQLMVKYHDVDEKLAKRHPNANAAKGWTSQIICDDYTFFGWDSLTKKASITIVGEDKFLSGTAPSDSRFHIPLRDAPSHGSSDQVISFKAEQADDETPDSFDLYGFFLYYLNIEKASKCLLLLLFKLYTNKICFC